MDTITHGIAGAVIAKAGFSKRLGRIGTIAGVVSAILPDADSILRIFGEEIFLKYHRGIGNSIFFMFPIALVLAFLFNRISKRNAFGIFFLLALIELTVHNFLDLQNSFGTMLLYPFSDRRFSLDMVFIIDLYYTGILLAGLILAYVWKGRGEMISKSAIVILALYTGLCAINHSRALNLAKSFAMTQRLDPANIASLPQPLSPFRWANYIETDKKIYQGFVDLRGENPERKNLDTYIGRFKTRFNSPENLKYNIWVRFPDSPAVNKALSLEGTKFFLWFARFPVLLEEKNEDDLHILRFFDLQFGSFEGRYPFLYEVVFDKEGKIISEGFIDGSILSLRGNR
jgi:inner membrane protein